MRLLAKIANYFGECARKNRECACPACGYFALVYSGETAGCALCGVEIDDRQEVERLRQRGKRRGGRREHAECF